MVSLALPPPPDPVAVGLHPGRGGWAVALPRPQPAHLVSQTLAFPLTPGLACPSPCCPRGPAPSRGAQLSRSCSL